MELVPLFPWDGAEERAEGADGFPTRLSSQVSLVVAVCRDGLGLAPCGVEPPSARAEEASSRS